MPDTTPLVRNIEHPVPAVTIAADAETDLTEAGFAGTVTKVDYIAATAIAGADTNSRTVVLVNKGAGSGNTVIATKAFTNGVNAAADAVTSVPLSVVAGATTVAAGDVLVWQSTHVGTGIVDPGGMVHVELSRS